MRRVQEIETAAESTRDVTIPGGCMLCGGDLAMRVTPSGARSVCSACRWISRPQMRHEEGGIVVLHPAGLIG